MPTVTIHESGIPRVRRTIWFRPAEQGQQFFPEAGLAVGEPLHQLSPYAYVPQAPPRGRWRDVGPGMVPSRSHRGREVFTKEFQGVAHVGRRVHFLGQAAEGFQFDVYKLQEALVRIGTGARPCAACADVVVTGRLRTEDVLALQEVAFPWDETFLVAEPDGALSISIVPGSKPGLPKDVTVDAWSQLAVTVDTFPGRPEEPAPADAAAAVTVPEIPKPPKPEVAPADSQGLEAGAAMAYLTVTGFYTGPLPAEIDDAVWSDELLAAFDNWAKARRIVYAIYPNPDELVPGSSKLIAPTVVVLKLAEEAEKTDPGRLVELYAQMGATYAPCTPEAPCPTGWECVEGGCRPVARVTSARAWWPALLAGGIVLGGAFVLMRGRRR